MEFNFKPQHQMVQGLLNSGMAVLPYVPEPEKSQFIDALRNFETFSAPMLWSKADVDPSNELNLTDDEKEEAFFRFIEGYECKEADWSVLAEHAVNVQSAMAVQRFVRVEYDPQYTGGDYEGTGAFAYIPSDLVEAFAAETPDSGDGVELAFTKVTKLDSMHIIHYTLDERYGSDRNLIKE